VATRENHARLRSVKREEGNRKGKKIHSSVERAHPKKREKKVYHSNGCVVLPGEDQDEGEKRTSSSDTSEKEEGKDRHLSIEPHLLFGGIQGKVWALRERKGFELD